MEVHRYPDHGPSRANLGQVCADIGGGGEGGLFLWDGIPFWQCRRVSAVCAIEIGQTIADRDHLGGVVAALGDDRGGERLGDRADAWQN